MRQLAVQSNKAVRINDWSLVYSSVMLDFPAVQKCSASTALIARAHLHTPVARADHVSENFKKIRREISLEG